MNIWETFILFFSFQGLIFSIILLLKKKGNRHGHRLWAFFLALFAYNIFFNVLYWSKVNTDLMIKLGRSYIFPMSLYGPLFYFYIASHRKAFRWRWSDLVHFIPAIITLYFVLDPSLIRVSIFKGPYLEYVLVALMGGYALAAYSNNKNHLENLHPELKTWLKVLCIAFFGFALAWASYYFLVMFGWLATEHDYIITLSMILFIAATTYVGIEFPEIFNGKKVKQLIPIAKYQKTGLPPKISLAWKVKLDQYMEKNKPYLDGMLRLDDLAEGVGFSRHHTSQIINEHYDGNFFDYVNSYRVRDAAELLMQDYDQKMQINEVSWQVGFNNRTSFYSAFKKAYGVTPTEYRKLQLSRG